MKSTAPKDPALLAQTNLVRILEANLKVITQEISELQFRRSLIKQVSSQAESMNAGLITRLYEAVCAVEYPKGDVIKLRVKLQEIIGKNLSFPAATATTPAAKP